MSPADSAGFLVSDIVQESLAEVLLHRNNGSTATTKVLAARYKKIIDYKTVRRVAFC